MSEKIINNHIKCYLIGAMEKTANNDSGRGWRDKLRPEIHKRVDQNGNPIYIFDPTREEQNKVGLPPQEFHQKMKGWVEGGNHDKIKEGSDLIWLGKDYLEPTEDGQGKLVHIMGDVDYVRNSDFLICHIAKGDKPCGTYFEAGLAMMNKIPIYVLQTMPRSEYDLSFIMWVEGSRGAFFNTTSDLMDHITKTYKLKVRKNPVSY